jgi:L-iditol 2-dehydrogenase
MIKSILTLDKKLIVRNVEIPFVKSDEILLKVLSCAICGSDLKIVENGNKRIVEERTIGHEIAGEVSILGSKINNYNVGDKVSLSADLPCNECSYCVSGRVNLCNKNFAVGYQFDGGFSQYMILNKFILNNGPIKKFSKITPDEACLAEPLACAINGVEKSIQCFSLDNPSNALVYGGGPIGLLIAEYLYYRNIKYIVII